MTKFLFYFDPKDEYFGGENNKFEVKFTPGCFYLTLIKDLLKE